MEVKRRGFCIHLRFKALMIEVALGGRTLEEGTGMGKGIFGKKYKTYLKMESYMF